MSDEHARLRAGFASPGRGRAPPEIALILGSGLGRLADAVDGAVAIPYARDRGLPGRPRRATPGGWWSARLFGRPVALMQGRLHLYEGWSPREIALRGAPAARLGADELVVTNAAGALDPEFEPGDVMLIEDHLNFTGVNPLTGPNDERIGLRFPDMSRAYDRELRDGGARGAEAAGRAAPPRHLRRRRRALARDLGRAALPPGRRRPTRSACRPSSR